jgi:hypothetical protein
MLQRRAALALIAGAALLLLFGCRTTVGEYHEYRDHYERFEVQQGTIRAGGITWGFKVEGVRHSNSIAYEFWLTNLSEQTLPNVRGVPNDPLYTGRPYEAGTLVPGRTVHMRWEWKGQQLPNGVRLTWDGGSLTIPVYGS